jgi:oxalate decarboxylase
MIAGNARITSADNDGHNFVADVTAGDLWYFPEVFAHTPKETLAKNFAVNETAFDRIPQKQRFSFQTDPPARLQDDIVADPQGRVPQDMRFRRLQQSTISVPGSRVRIADTRNFRISTEIAVVLVEVDSGHMRETHWHPNADEWQYYASRQGWMRVFAAEAKARTFDFQAGDVGYVPMSMSHFIENIGSTPHRFLELFKSARFMDVSLAQWMALTPHELTLEP